MHAIGYIVFFVTFLSLAVLAWLVLLLWRLLGNRRRKPTQPECASCGYPTIRLSSPRCPECGADLLREGVLAPSMRVRGAGGVFLVIVAWTIAITTLTLFLASWVAFALPATAQTASTSTGEPASAQYQRVVVRASGTFDSRLLSNPFSQSLTDITVTVVALDGAAHDLRLSRENPLFPFRLETGEHLDEIAGPYAVDVLRALLVRAGASPDDPATRAEAAELANIINGSSFWGFGTGRAGPFINTTTAASANPAGNASGVLWVLMPVGVCLTGLGLWIAGVVIIANQHMKRFRPIRAGRQQPYGDPLPDQPAQQHASPDPSS